MNRNRTLVLASVALAMAFLAVGCDRLWNDQPSNQKTGSSWYWVPGGPAFLDWMMSGSSIVGQAKIERPTNVLLNVGFQMFGTRMMTKNHVHVATSALGVPANVNNYMYKSGVHAGVPVFTAPITWQFAWDSSNKLWIAMYCEFTGGGDCNTWQHTYQWVVNVPHKDVNLTTNVVHFFGQHPGNTPTPNYSYWQFKFTGTGNIGDVVDGVFYPGWCAEQTHYMNQNQDYLAVLWSSLYWPLPIRLRLVGAYEPAGTTNSWDHVNYLLNNKIAAATFWDTQAAIWYLLGTGAAPGGVNANLMATDAVANGDGFLPGAGQKLAVILEPVCERQLVFIEIDP